MLYPGTELATNYKLYSDLYGTSLIRDEYWDSIHSYQVNPSRSLSFHQLNELSIILSKILSDDYSNYVVKAHGQLPQWMTYEQWKASYDGIAEHLHPFNWRTNEVTSRSRFQALA
jgi:hypothetical protein